MKLQVREGKKEMRSGEGQRADSSQSLQKKTKAHFHLDLGLPASRIVTKQVWVVSRYLAHDSNFVHLP